MNLKEYEMSKTKWTESELERKELVESGQPVHANKRSDHNLIVWAKSNGVLARIDRGTKWGNPFVMGKHGNRDEVCEQYQARLDERPDLQANAESLRGEVLLCWCYPERCYGESLLRVIESNNSLEINEAK